jgi:transposase
MWCLRGIRAVAPSRRRYQNGYLYAALEVGGNASEFLFTPCLNKDWGLAFLRQISAHDPQATHIVIGDGAGLHHRKDEEPLPDNVKIITLPAYSPELNPVEKLWDIVKDGICNRDWKNLDELEEKITERIKPYWEDAKHVAKLIGNGYLVSELNATWKIELRQFN